MKTNKLIAEQNLLIARFMDWKQIPIRSGFKYQLFENDIIKKEVYDDNFKFSTSWEWLMPVVEKIKNMSTPLPKEMNTDQIITHIKIIDAIMPFCQIVYTNRLLSQWINRKESVPCDVNRFSANGKHLKEAVYSAVVQFITWYNDQPR